MTKCQLLKKLHKLAWEHDDLMNQDTLFKIQDIIDKEILSETVKGNLEITQLSNGFIKSVKIPKKKPTAVKVPVNLLDKTTEKWDMPQE